MGRQLRRIVLATRSAMETPPGMRPALATQRAPGEVLGERLGLGAALVKQQVPGVALAAQRAPGVALAAPCASGVAVGRRQLPGAPPAAGSRPAERGVEAVPRLVRVVLMDLLLPSAVMAARPAPAALMTVQWRPKAAVATHGLSAAATTALWQMETVLRLTAGTATVR